MLLNCGVGEDSWESFGLQGDPTSPSWRKSVQSWVFTARTDVEAESPILWPPDGKSWLIGKDPDAGKVWGQEEQGTPDDEMVGWHHRLNRHGFGWPLRVGYGQGGLVCCSPWGRKELDTTERLNWTESMMLSNHLILCHCILLLLSIFPIFRVVFNYSALWIRWPKYWSFTFNISPSNVDSGIIFFRVDWFEVLAAQGSLKSILQNYSLKALTPWCSTFFMVQLSHPHMTMEKP